MGSEEIVSDSKANSERKCLDTHIKTYVIRLHFYHRTEINFSGKNPSLYMYLLGINTYIANGVGAKLLKD